MTCLILVLIAVYAIGFGIPERWTVRALVRWFRSR